MVSKFYLHAWGDDSGCVDVFDLEGMRGFKTATGSATVVSFAYDPNVLSNDLERDFGDIESAAAPSLLRLRQKEALSRAGQLCVIDFLDMHLERGRYADQSKVQTPALVMMTDSEPQERKLGLGDRLLLSRFVDGPVRLGAMGLESWPWRVYEWRDGEKLLTGDGAVLLWKTDEDSEIGTVTFPLSPTLILVIGGELPYDMHINPVIVRNSRRWLVGNPGTLDASLIAAARSTSAN